MRLSDSFNSALSGRRIAAQRGFTLLELVVAIALASLVIGGATTVVLKSEQTFQEQVLQLELDNNGRKVVDRLAEELRQAHPDSILPLLMTNSDYIQFQKVTGYSAGNVVLGPTITIRLNANKYGHVDYTEAGQPNVELSGKVVGLRFNYAPGGIAFEVDIGLFDREGLLQQKTFSQQVTFRN